MHLKHLRVGRCFKNPISIFLFSFSLQVRDLLKRMLTVDPIKRISIDDIRKHPWFVVDLPPHLFPQERDEDASIIDKVCLPPPIPFIRLYTQTPVMKLESLTVNSY